MDPNETLGKLRIMAGLAINGNEDGAWVDARGNFSLGDYTDMGEFLMDFAELFGALDEWLLKGGLIPHDWKLAHGRLGG